jgi:hypothetical protein
MSDAMEEGRASGEQYERDRIDALDRMTLDTRPLNGSVRI